MHAVAVHRGEPGMGVAVAGVAHRLHVPRLQRELLAAPQLLVDRRLGRDRVVEEVVQLRRHPLAHGVERQGDVRIRRDELRAHGGSPVR